MQLTLRYGFSLAQHTRKQVYFPGCIPNKVEWMRRRLPDILIILGLFALPLLFFWPQTLGGRTLLPTENLYQFEPYATYREVVSAPAVPHNALLSDLVLQNYQWKSFIRESIAQGEIPLWNPHQFSGIPFLAAGQQSALYPFSLLYYVLPLPVAYGWFTVVQLWLAGVAMYAFMRTLGLFRIGGAVAGISYQLSAFFVTSAVFPMITGTAAWMPLLLLAAEQIIRQGTSQQSRIPNVLWTAGGAIALACSILAGHVEITYYTLIILAAYAGVRVLWQAWKGRSKRANWLAEARHVLWLTVLVMLGIGLSAVQFVPLFELASINFRDGRASLDEVLGWAHPWRDLIQFIMPNFYGNPSHHSYLDVFTGQTIQASVNALGQPITVIDWGIKNYVESALYVGILPLALASFALVDTFTRRKEASHQAGPPYRVFFTGLAAVALTFMFGMLTYAVLFYTLPGINQLHSPFRWIYAVTLSVAVLAGFGADALARSRDVESPAWQQVSKLAKRTGWALIALGTLILAVLLASHVLYPQIEPLVARMFEGMAKANEAFSDTAMFYSYQFRNVLLLGLFVLIAGIVIRVSRCPIYLPMPGGKRPVWEIMAALVIALDLMAASWGFNPASDPALLDFRPPAIEWLQGQAGEWRYITLDDPSQRPLMQANMTMRYGLDDVRGYESIIPKSYVDFMQQLAPQNQLQFNRVAPLYTSDDFIRSLESDPPLLNLLNVRYLITHQSTTLPQSLTTVPLRGSARWTLVYEDEAVRIWQNTAALPRVYTVINDTLDNPITGWEVETIQQTSRERLMQVRVDAPQWLVISQTYIPGWRAFIRPVGSSEDSETPLDVQQVQGVFQGVQIPEAGTWLVRLVYSPPSFQIGLFGSFISTVVLVFMVGVWGWRRMFGAREEVSGVSLIARNSFAPILLNLFNRGIDFGFAFIMLRVLGPEDAGLYYYAAFIFGWFDIFTNFGLNTYLTREVARNRDQAGRILFNTSVLRLILMVVGIALLLAFIIIRQTAISPQIAPEGILAIALLYVGLLPNSLSTGMSALFYAFERAEMPAAIATIATLSKTILGVLVLALGAGVVGLAGVSILTNVVTLGVMLYAGRKLIGKFQAKLELPLIRTMVGESWPLMLNHFLATIFFQIDVVIIEAIHGTLMVGQYSVAYKWVAALNVIPSFFTMALLPVMSRQAHEDRNALKRTYRLGVKLLVSIAFPTAVLFTFSAYFLTGVLGGMEYLPDGAIATQLMIWSICVGWINSLTQYVLIALDLQRKITRAFILGVSFNIIANVLLVPTYGYRAAAIVTFFSEAILLVPFAVLLYQSIGAVRWGDLIWRPGMASLAMAVVLYGLWPTQPILALLVAVCTYIGILLVLRPLSADERARLTPLIPGPLRRRRSTP